jgi:hypothetical protein
MDDEGITKFIDFLSGRYRVDRLQRVAVIRILELTPPFVADLVQEDLTDSPRDVTVDDLRLMCRAAMTVRADMVKLRMKLEPPVEPDLRPRRRGG